MALRSGAAREFEAVFDVVERPHLEGDDYVRELAPISLIGGIQNVAEWRELGGKNVSLQAFVSSLRPETARWWQGLDDFRRGRSPAVRAAEGRD